MGLQLLGLPMIGAAMGGPVGFGIGALAAIAAAYGISQIPGVSQALTRLTSGGIPYSQVGPSSDVVTAQQNLQFFNNQMAVTKMQAEVQQANYDALYEMVRQYSAGQAAQAVDSVVKTSTTAEEVRGRTGAIITPLPIPNTEQQALIDAATRVWESNQARTRAAESAAAAQAGAVATGVADLTGTSIPMPDATNMAIPLTAAGLAALVPTIAKAMSQASHSQTIACQTSTGAAMLANVMQSALPTALAAGFMLNPGIQSALTGLAGKALEALYKPLEQQAPITPEKAPGIGVNLLMQAVLLGSGAHLLSVTAEAAAPLKNLGLGYLSAFMADMAGFSRIAAAFQGMMIQWGLAQPMRYWALQKFRPMVPREQDLQRLYGEYAITRPEFDQFMTYHGYSGEWINRLAELADRPLSPMLFRYLGEAGLLDSDLIDRELKNAAYNPATVPYLKQWLERVAAGELKGQYASSILKTYRLGRLTDEALISHLGNLGYSGRQMTRALYAARLDLGTELAEDCRQMFVDQFKSGLIEAPDLDLRLAALDYVPARRSVEIAKNLLKRKPKKEAKVDPRIEAEMRKLQAKYVQAYIMLYHLHKLDLEGLREAIVSVGVSAELADITANLEYLKETAESEKLEAKETAAAVAAAKSKYDALARASAAELAREKATEAKLSETTILTLYRKGYATIDEVGQALLALGKPPGEVAGIIELESARALPVVGV